MQSQWLLQRNVKPHVINFNWHLFYIKVFSQLTSTLSQTACLGNLKTSLTLLQAISYTNIYCNPCSRKITKPSLNRRISYNSKFIKTSQYQTRDTVSLTFTDSYRNSLFELYLQFTQVSPTAFFKPHGNLLPFFINNLTGNSTFVNVSKTYSRWLQFNQLLENIFINDLKCFIFSVKPLRQECTAFNWTEKCFDYDLFKKSTPYFFKKDIQFGSDSITIFNRFERAGLSTAFVTDSQYHWKNLYYLRRVGVYTISPTALNSNPWDVHFSLPVGSNNLVSQYFFVKLLISKKHHTKYRKFEQLKLNWL